MNITCTSCSKKYEIEIPSGADHNKLKVKCGKCGTVQTVADGLSATSEEVERTFIIPISSDSRAIGAHVHFIDKEGKKLISLNLKYGDNVFGRGSENSINYNGNNVNIKDDSVSKRHLSIFLQNSQTVKERVMILQDLSSTNGTFLNGKKLDPLEKIFLQNEDIITIGKHFLVFEIIKS